MFFQIKSTACQYLTLLIFCFLSFFTNESHGLQELTEEEKNIVNTFVQGYDLKKKSDLEKIIGQIFLVGLPDTNGCEIENVKKLITVNGIGGVVLQPYNLSTRKDNDYTRINIRKSTCFIGDLQETARNNNSKISLFIAAYHDSPGNSSIPYDKNFMSLPGLTLAATNDLESIYHAGELQGSQLQRIGVNMLLGPCINKIHAFNNRSSCNNHSYSHFFAGHRDYVYNFSSRFIDGLHQTNLIVIGKYIPALIPQKTCYGKHNNFLPSNLFASKLQGVMTSYVIFSALDDRYSPATFSKDFIAEIVRSKSSEKTIQGLGFSDHVIISADLSKMELIKQYQKDTGTKKKLTFTDVAIKAFNAGNDILFFSRLADSKPEELTSHTNAGIVSKTVLTVDQIGDIITKFIIEILNNDTMKHRLERSLERVLQLKARSIKSLCGEFRGFSSICKPDNKEIGLDNFKELMHNNSDYQTSEAFVKSMIEKSIIQINKNDKRLYKIKQLEDIHRVFYVAENGIQLFKKEFQDGNPEFIPIPENKGTEWLDNVQNSFFKHIESKNCIAFTCLDEVDAKLLNIAYDKYGDTFTEKLILFIHNSPTILSQKLTSSATILGCFTRHPLSYIYDIKMLRGENISPHQISNLPVSLGNNSIYDFEYERFQTIKEKIASMINRENYDSDMKSKQREIDKCKTRIEEIQTETQKKLDAKELACNKNIRDVYKKLESCKAEAEEDSRNVHKKLESCIAEAKEYSRNVHKKLESCKAEAEQYSLNAYEKLSLCKSEAKEYSIQVNKLRQELSKTTATYLFVIIVLFIMALIFGISLFYLYQKLNNKTKA